MSSIFTGKSGLRHTYVKMLAADFAGATTAATAKMLAVIAPAGGARMAFFDNRLDAEVTVLLVHPDADSTNVASRLLFIEIAPDQVINYDLVASPSLEFDPGTKVFVFCAAPPTTGKLKFAWWG